MRYGGDGIVVFDTDIFIWIQRGNEKAARLVDGAVERLLSLQTYLELLQGATGKRQMDDTCAFLRDFGFQILPLTPEIGYRAAVYIESYALSHGLRAGDALVAATAFENGKILCTANEKHFKALSGLELRVLKP